MLNFVNSKNGALVFFGAFWMRNVKNFVKAFEC